MLQAGKSRTEIPDWYTKSAPVPIEIQDRDPKLAEADCKEQDQTASCYADNR